MSTKKDELLPCPFCGQQPAVECFEKKTWWDVTCSNYECPIIVRTRQDKPFKTKASAIKAWNRRKGDE